VDFAELSKKLKPKVSPLPKVRSAPRLVPPAAFNGASQYKDALAAEQAARRRLTRIQKQLVHAASMSSLQEQKEKKRVEGLAVRQMSENLTGREITKRFASIAPASETEVAALAIILHEKMAKTFVEPQWIKLFQFMDNDRSGRITYDEMEKMVRSQLLMSKAELPDSVLRSLWVALDEDASGYICAGEFGRFMKKGGKEPGPNFRQRMTERNKKAVAAVKAETEELSGEGFAKAMAAVPVASEEELVALAEQLTTKMAKLFPGTDRSWMKLYKWMDDDKSGRISFDELKGAVRRRLQLGETELSEARLISVWKAIDEDDSGYVSFAEFGKLMRKASALKAQQAVARETEDETSRRKRMALEDRAARQLAAKVEEDKRLVAAAMHAAAVANQLAEDAARLERALKKGDLKGHSLRAGQSQHARIQPGAGDDQPLGRQVPGQRLRPKRVGIGVDF